MLLLITSVILVPISVCCYLFLEVQTVSDSVGAAFPHPSAAVFHINPASILHTCEEPAGVGPVNLREIPSHRPLAERAGGEPPAG